MGGRGSSSSHAVMGALADSGGGHGESEWYPIHKAIFNSMSHGKNSVSMMIDNVHKVMDKKGLWGTEHGFIFDGNGFLEHSGRGGSRSISIPLPKGKGAWNLHTHPGSTPLFNKLKMSSLPSPQDVKSFANVQKSGKGFAGTSIVAKTDTSIFKEKRVGKADWDGFSKAYIRMATRQHDLRKHVENTKKIAEKYGIEYTHIIH